MKKNTIITAIIIVLAIAIIATIIWLAKPTPNAEEQEPNTVEDNGVQVTNRTQTDNENLVTESDTMVGGKFLLGSHSITAQLDEDEQRETIEIVYYADEEISQSMLELYGKGQYITGIIVRVTNGEAVTDFTLTGRNFYFANDFEPQIVDLDANDQKKEIVIKWYDADSSSPWDDYIFMQYDGQSLQLLPIGNNRSLPNTVNAAGSYIRSTENLQIGNKVVVQMASKKVETYTYDGEQLMQTSVKLAGNAAFYEQYLKTWQSNYLPIYAEPDTTTEQTIVNIEEEIDSFTVEEVQDHWLTVATATVQGYVYIEDIIDMPGK